MRVFYHNELPYCKADVFAMLLFSCCSELFPLGALYMCYSILVWPYQDLIVDVLQPLSIIMLWNFKGVTTEKVLYNLICFSCQFWSYTAQYTISSRVSQLPNFIVNGKTDPW